MRERRGDRARHSFEVTLEPPKDVGLGYWLNQVRCRKCGEERRVGVPVSTLNFTERWCVVPPTLWQRLIRCFKNT